MTASAPTTAPAGDQVDDWNRAHRAYWDRLSATYDGLYRGAWSRRENKWVRRQLSFLRDLDAPTVVDIGCGTGLGLRMVRALNPTARYVGVDVSPGMVGSIDDTAAELHVAAMDELSFLADGEADVVLALFSTVSFAFDTRRVFREIARVLKPGGVAYVSVLSARALSRHRDPSEDGHYRTRGDQRPAAGVPARRLSVADLEELAATVGLGVARTTGMNVLSGLFEAPPLWGLGRLAARWKPDYAHTIEVLLRKEAHMHVGTAPEAPGQLRPERLHEAFPIYRVACGPRLPAGWDGAVLGCAESYREMSLLSGDSVTSRQRLLGMAADCPVGVVTGKVVANELSWLHDFYSREVADLVNALGHGVFETSVDERSAVNINILPPGSEYEWHVDSNPMTGLLFVTDQPAGTGGELVFQPDPVTRPDESWSLTVEPRAGDLLMFDGREAAHSVRLVTGPADRLSVPMNFYHAGGGTTRPNDLDGYLYG